MTSVTVPKVSLSPKEFVVSGEWNISGLSERETPPTDASGYSGDEERHAAVALQGHIALLVGMLGEWKKIPSSVHEHVQLLSEPDD